jgi:metal-sulfur cluster biosynthetic enzyme
MADQEQQPVTEQPTATPEQPTADTAPAPQPTAAAAGADAPVAHPEVPTEEDVYEALEEVIDPELGLDFVSLGLVYDVAIEKEDVYVTFTLTTPACPIGPQVSEQMKEFVGDLPGVSAVHPKMVFDPSWSPEMMTEDAKFALGF